jgi:hypothetical protein
MNTCFLKGIEMNKKNFFMLLLLVNSACLLGSDLSQKDQAVELDYLWTEVQGLSDATAEEHGEHDELIAKLKKKLRKEKRRRKNLKEQVARQGRDLDFLTGAVLGNGDEGRGNDGVVGKVDRLSRRFNSSVEKQSEDDAAAVKDIGDLQKQVRSLQGAVEKLQAAKSKAPRKSKAHRDAVAAVKKKDRK